MKFGGVHEAPKFKEAAAAAAAEERRRRRNEHPLEGTDKECNNSFSKCSCAPYQVSSWWCQAKPEPAPRPQVIFAVPTAMPRHKLRFVGS